MLSDFAEFGSFSGDGAGMEGGDSYIQDVEGWRVAILDVMTVVGSKGGHTEYKIETRMPGDKAVVLYRRYREFWAMDQLVKKMYPDCISSLPEKRRFGKMENNVIEERKVGLTKYLHTLLSLTVVRVDRRCNQVVCTFLTDKEYFKVCIGMYPFLGVFYLQTPTHSYMYKGYNMSLKEASVITDQVCLWNNTNHCLTSLSLFSPLFLGCT